MFSLVGRVHEKIVPRLFDIEEENQFNVDFTGRLSPSLAIDPCQVPTAKTGDGINWWANMVQFFYFVVINIRWSKYIQHIKTWFKYLESNATKHINKTITCSGHLQKQPMFSDIQICMCPCKRNKKTCYRKTAAEGNVYRYMYSISDSTQ